MPGILPFALYNLSGATAEDSDGSPEQARHTPYPSPRWLSRTI